MVSNGNGHGNFLNVMNASADLVDGERLFNAGIAGRKGELQGNTA
jgi:hypothetical protein